MTKGRVQQQVMGRYPPLSIKMVLHYYACASPMEGMENPVQQEIANKFVKEGILSKDGPTFRVTPRGCAWAEMICSTPLPIEAWSDPRNVEIVRFGK